MIDMGYKNFIDENLIREVITPETSKARWLRKEAIAGRMLIDCTQGRKTNTLLTLKTGHLVLSSLKYPSLLRRIKLPKIKVAGKKKSINKEFFDAINSI